jgi:hypothetical protein
MSLHSLRALLEKGQGLRAEVGHYLTLPQTAEAPKTVRLLLRVSVFLLDREVGRLAEALGGREATLGALRDSLTADHHVGVASLETFEGMLGDSPRRRVEMDDRGNILRADTAVEDGEDVDEAYSGRGDW